MYKPALHTGLSFATSTLEAHVATKHVNMTQTCSTSNNPVLRSQLAGTHRPFAKNNLCTGQLYMLDSQVHADSVPISLCTGPMSGLTR